MVSLNTYGAVQSSLYGAGLSTYPLMMIAVPLKLWGRILKGGLAGLGWDDALCVLALVLDNAFFYSCMIGLRPDLGKHALVQVSLPNVEAWLKILFVAQLLYTCCITANKSAILTFYWRLFSVKSRLPILFAVTVVIGWCLGIFFAVLFTCVPIRAQWDLTITDKKCISTRSIWLGGSLVNVLTDLMLIILPLPYVWKLHAPVAQRIALAGMFLLGCFVNVVSIVRLCILMSLNLSSSDVTFNFSEVVIWSVVEVNCGLICACLPSLRPAFTRLGFGRIFGGSSHTPSPSQGMGPSGVGGVDSGALRPYGSASWKGRGLFSVSVAESGTYRGREDEEDSYEMIKQAHQEQGQTTTSVEPARSSVSEERSAEEPAGIEVKRHWAISQEPMRGR